MAEIQLAKGPRLEPDVSASMLGRGVNLRLDMLGVAKFLRVDMAGMRDILASRRLTATGVPDGRGGWRDVAIMSDDLLAYMREEIAAGRWESRGSLAANGQSLP